MNQQPHRLKAAVRSHWAQQPCGTRDIPTEQRKRFFEEIERERYAWEPYLKLFARFEEGRGRRVLEIGVGAGTDFVQWARSGARAVGIDLTTQGVELTRERLALEGRDLPVFVADAENLPFADATFDLVYSYGVLHHSPDTPRAIHEVHRVLAPGGTARIMIYHCNSWVGFALWAVHGLGHLRPWKTPRWAIYHHLESPGTKAYTIKEARALFVAFRDIKIRTQLSHGDLLLMRPSERYRRWYHDLAWRLYPRGIIRRSGDRFGTAMLIEATK